MDTLDKYLIKEFLMYFIASLLVLGVLYVAIDFLSHFWSMDMTASRTIELYWYKTPAAINQFVPVACLMGTLFVLATMSKQNEILALYASGVSNIRVISTFVAIVACVSTIAFLVFDPVVPAFQKRQYLLERGMDPGQEALINFNKAGFWYRSGNIIYNVGHFDPKTNLLDDLNVFVLSPSFRLTEYTHAKKAAYEGNDWTLQDGFSVRYPISSEFPESEKFKLKTRVIPEKPSDFKTLKVEEGYMRLKELRLYIGRNQSYGLDTTAQQVHYHERVALIFAPLVFVLLALGFGLNPLKTHSVPKSVMFSVGVVFIYLLTFRMSLSIGRGGHIPPFIAGWVPNFMFLGLSIAKVMRR